MQIEVNKEYSFDDDQFLWRYIDLHRLIYFLNTENIFFSPLNAFFDPLEGITEKHLQNQNIIRVLEGSISPEDDLQDLEIRELQEEKEEFTSNLREIQRNYFASSWYLGVRESLAMWDTYSNKDSVALKFEPKDLIDSIFKGSEKINSKDFPLLIHGKVEYFKISPFDAEDESIKNCGHRFKGFLKDLSYKHEEEFRFLAIQNKEKKRGNPFEVKMEGLQSLDFRIVTHPYMEPWKYNNIYNILKTSGLENKLMKSEIPTRRQVFDTP